jgi:hypothetical protein
MKKKKKHLNFIKKNIYNIKIYNINLVGKKKYFYIKIIFLGCVIGTPVNFGGMTGKALKLILFHQESRTCQNHNMVKFRALLFERSQHKKGTCSVSLRVPSNFAKWEHNK